MPGPRTFFRAGASIWVLGGLGHFVLIDVLTLHGRTRVSQLIPNGDVIGAMERTTLSFGYLGSTTMFQATAGFSLWVACSLVLLGLIYLLIGRQADIALGPFTRVGLLISCIFCAIAATYFIVPPIVGAALTMALFTTSWIRNER